MQEPRALSGSGYSQPMGLFDRLIGRDQVHDILLEEFKATLAERPLTRGSQGEMRMELHERQRDFLAERLPRGPEAVTAAKRAGLFKIDRDFAEAKGSSGLLHEAFKKAKLIHWVDPDDYGNPGEWVAKLGRRSWADVLHADSRTVKRHFDIPLDADPQQTVELLSEALITYEFKQGVDRDISVPLDEAFAKELKRAAKEREREQKQARKEALEASPYRALIDDGRPVLSDMGAAAKVQSTSVGQGHDGPAPGL